MKRGQTGYGWMLASVVLAILLALLPLPTAISPLRPYGLALVMAYWVLETPERAGLGFAFFCGLLADFASGAILGEQALRMVILAFILDRFRTRLRFFPTWQQALVIGALLLNDRIVSAVVHALVNAPQGPAAYWLSPLAGALMWGPVFLVLDALRHGHGRA
ncbi:rod shape-determining protein MreD [Lysobacter oculi]|uniref:Rod shape-determining protein MreD n=1 Tax=Solilutibacter oculi TaxID=2698682 RepID=A0A344J6Z2_9GAMM|nr:rod shape-determining protein MreD [Lysobacter oculi]AXA84802.1 rod shape-determining protein MreD [Lysobacter oculi]